MSNFCLTDVIGLTRTKCNCPKADGTLTDYNASDSGYFIGDELNLMDTLYTDCSNTSFLSTLQTIRERAINDFETDIQATMLKMGYKTKGGYSGIIGDTKYNGVTNSNVFNGVIVRAGGLMGSTLKVSSLTLGWSTGGENVTMSIYEGDAYNLGTLIESVNILTIANNYVTANLTQTRTFDLSNRDKYIRIVYTGHTAGQPLNNKIHCGCGGGLPHWLNFMSMNGFTSPSLNVNLLGSNGDFIQGIVINGEVKCDGLSWMCSVNCNTSILKKIAAKAILFKAVELTAQHILDQQNINFFTLLHREALYGKRSHAQKEFGEILQYLAIEIPKENAACFICQSNGQRLVPTYI